MALGQHHQQRRRLEVRLAVDHQRRHLAARIDAQVFRAALRVTIEVDELEPECGAPISSSARCTTMLALPGA
jgi:hypothetical protein